MARIYPGHTATKANADLDAIVASLAQARAVTDLASPYITTLLPAADDETARETLGVSNTEYTRELLLATNEDEARGILGVGQSEEGDWPTPPSLRFAGGSVTGYGSTRVGRYIRIGNSVTISARVSVATVSTPSGAVFIQNLPFVPKWYAIDTFVANVMVANADTGGPTQWTGRIDSDTAELRIFGIDDGALVDPGAYFLAGTELSITVTYIAYTGPALTLTNADIFPTAASAGATNGPKPGMRFLGGDDEEQSGASTGDIFGLTDGQVRPILVVPDMDTTYRWLRGATDGPRGRYPAIHQTVPAGSGENAFPQIYVIMDADPRTAVTARMAVKIDHQFPSFTKHMRFESDGSGTPIATLDVFGGDPDHHGIYAIGVDAYQAAMLNQIGHTEWTEYQGGLEGGGSLIYQDASAAWGNGFAGQAAYQGKYHWVKMAVDVVQHATLGSIRVRLWRSHPNNINLLVPTIDGTLQGTAGNPVDTTGIAVHAWLGPGTVNTGSRPNDITMYLAEIGLASDPDDIGASYDIEAA